MRIPRQEQDEEEGDNFKKEEDHDTKLGLFWRILLQEELGGSQQEFQALGAASFSAHVACPSTEKHQDQAFRLTGASGCADSGAVFSRGCLVTCWQKKH